MTGDTLRLHFDALVEDIELGYTQEAEAIEAEDTQELETLNPSEAAAFNADVEDERFLVVAAKTCAHWRDHSVAA